MASEYIMNEIKNNSLKQNLLHYLLMKEKTYLRKHNCLYCFKTPVQ